MGATWLALARQNPDAERDIRYGRPNREYELDVAMIWILYCFTALTETNRSAFFFD